MMTTEPFPSAHVWQGGRIGPSRWDPASLAPQGVPGPPPNPCWQLESLPCTRLLSDLQRLQMPEEISPRGSSSSAVPSSELSCSLLSLPCAAASPALRGEGALLCASSLGDLFQNCCWRRCVRVGMANFIPKNLPAGFPGLF